MPIWPQKDKEWSQTWLLSYWGIGLSSKKRLNSYLQKRCKHCGIFRWQLNSFRMVPVPLLNKKKFCCFCMYINGFVEFLHRQMGLPTTCMQHCNLSTDCVCRAGSETTWQVHFPIPFFPEEDELRSPKLIMLFYEVRCPCLNGTFILEPNERWVASSLRTRVQGGSQSTPHS